MNALSFGRSSLPDDACFVPIMRPGQDREEAIAAMHREWLDSHNAPAPWNLVSDSPGAPWSRPTAIGISQPSAPSRS